MLLVIDVGNTETVLGVFDNTELAAHWRVVLDFDVMAVDWRSAIKFANA